MAVAVRVGDGVVVRVGERVAVGVTVGWREAVAVGVAPDKLTGAENSEVLPLPSVFVAVT
jgi:hypothetical protein